MRALNGGQFARTPLTIPTPGGIQLPRMLLLLDMLLRPTFGRELGRRTDADQDDRLHFADGQERPLD